MTPTAASSPARAGSALIITNSLPRTSSSSVASSAARCASGSAPATSPFSAANSCATPARDAVLVALHRVSVATMLVSNCRCPTSDVTTSPRSAASATLVVSNPFAPAGTTRLRTYSSMSVVSVPPDALSNADRSSGAMRALASHGTGAKYGP